MMKRWSLIAMAGALLGAVSCTPMGGPLQGVGAGNGAARSGVGSATSNGALAGTTGSSSRATSGELRELRERRESFGNEQVIHSGGSSFSGGTGNSGFPSPNGASGDPDLNSPPLPPLSIDYRYALPVPGRPGWVLNPFTNRPIDVRGVESGRLIYDERDPENRFEYGRLRPVSEMPNKFRVP